MATFTMTLALLMGFTGSLHCAGMCGPIVWVMPFQHLNGLKKALAIFLYHFGRTTTYVILGLILHSFRELFNPQWQQHVSICLGVILLALGALAFFPNRSIKLNPPWAEHVKLLLGKMIGRPGWSTFLFTGFLNGLLPCGLVYMAFAASVSATTPWEVVGLMYSFGLGTIPMLVAITLLKSKLSLLRLHHFKKIVPVLMLTFGSLFILRGMNLGIPYLSPKIQMEQEQINTTCCHK